MNDCSHRRKPAPNPTSKGNSFYVPFQRTRLARAKSASQLLTCNRADTSTPRSTTSPSPPIASIVGACSPSATQYQPRKSAHGASQARSHRPPAPSAAPTAPARDGAGPYRDQRAAAAVLLAARRLGVQAVRPSPVGASRDGCGGRRGCGRRRRRGRLPVLAGPLGLGLQAALVQGEGLLALQLQALRGHGLVAGLAGAVVAPAELDAPAEPLHHRAVPRHHELRHGAGGQHHGPEKRGGRPLPLTGTAHRPPPWRGLPRSDLPRPPPLLPPAAGLT